MPHSRRTLLQTTGLALSSGTLASIAGCLRALTPSSDSSQDDSPSTTSSTDDGTSEGTAAIDFKQWLPDPTKTPLRDGYGVGYFDIARIRAHQDAIHENAYNRLETQMLRPVRSELVAREDVDATLQIDHIMDLAHGSFDPEAFGEKLTSDSRSSTPTSMRRPTTPTRTPWPEPERYHEFDLYGTEYVYAISEDVLMEVSPMGRGDAIKYAKAIIDAQAEQASLYADGNEYVAAMFEVIDDPHAVWCYPEAMDGSTFRGFRKDIITGGLKAWRFGPQTTHLTWANTYLDTEAAESGELKDYIESESDRFGPYEGLDIETEGRMAWTDGTIPTNEFDHLSPGGPGDSVSTAH